MTRVVISGLGVMSPNGNNRDAYWDSLSTGRSGLSTVSLFSPDKVKCQVVGEVKNLTYDCLPPKDRKRVPRIVPLAIHAAEEALRDARVSFDTMAEEQRREIGVIL